MARRLYNMEIGRIYLKARLTKLGFFYYGFEEIGMNINLAGGK